MTTMHLPVTVLGEPITVQIFEAAKPPRRQDMAILAQGLAFSHIFGLSLPRAIEGLYPAFDNAKMLAAMFYFHKFFTEEHRDKFVGPLTNFLGYCRIIDDDLTRCIVLRREEHEIGERFATYARDKVKTPVTNLRDALDIQLEHGLLQAIVADIGDGTEPQVALFDRARSEQGPLPLALEALGLAIQRDQCFEAALCDHRIAIGPYLTDLFVCAGPERIVELLGELTKD